MAMKVQEKQMSIPLMVQSLRSQEDQRARSLNRYECILFHKYLSLSLSLSLLHSLHCFLSPLSFLLMCEEECVTVW